MIRIRYAAFLAPMICALSVAGIGSPVPATEGEFVTRRGSTGGGFPTSSLDDIGGDDDPIVSADEIKGLSLDIATTGDIFVAVEVEDATDGNGIRVYRSQDGGSVWELWAELENTEFIEYSEPSLCIAEGTVDRVYLTCIGYSGTYTVYVSYAGLGDSAPTTLSTESVAGSVSELGEPSLDSDAVHFSNFRLYLTYRDADKIYFSRSIDQAANWSSPLRIDAAGASVNARSGQEIRYGRDGAVHCVWHSHYSPTDTWYVTYARADNFAATSGDWDAPIALTSAVGAEWNMFPHLAVSHGVGGKVVVSYDHESTDSRVQVSTDAGVTWPGTEGEQERSVEDLIALPGTLGFVAAQLFVSESAVAESRATHADPLTWQSPLIAGDAPAPVVYLETDFDATRGNRVGYAWAHDNSGDPDTAFFDAEWHADAGYANLEDGFPVGLGGGTAVASPALADLDGDPELEIIFGDDSGHIRVFESNGAEHSGWNTDIGDFPASEATIAVYDIDADGSNEVITANDAGLIFVFESDGSLRPGWPVNVESNLPVYVSVAASSSAGAGTIVACSDELHAFLPDASEVEGFPALIPGVAEAPAALGDLDEDGDCDMVVVAGDEIKISDFSGQSDRFSLGSASFTRACALGDLDSDGDLEIVLTGDGGSLWTLDFDYTTGRTVFPGSWPVSTAFASGYGGSPILASLDGGISTSILVNGWDGSSISYNYVFDADGSTHPTNWPVLLSATGDVQSPPLVDDVNGGDSDVFLPGNDFLWAQSQDGEDPVAGSTLDLPGTLRCSPATGDLDLDGRVELVVATSVLSIYDLGAPIESDEIQRWPMFAHDARRTSCLDCGSSDVVAVGDETTLPHRLSFATLRNPASAPVNLEFELPEPANVDLTVYDVTGRRVALVLRDQFGPGVHHASWDGHSRGGQQASAGVYYLRLSVGGASGERVLTRKAVLLP